jgi:hypothetical protein
MAQRQIPPERKAIFYIGMAVGVIGFLCFISTFFSAASSFGDFTNFEQRSSSLFTLAVVGMVMMIAGGVMINIGRMGLAGSGVKLDPRRRAAMLSRGREWPEAFSKTQWMRQVSS